MRLFLIALLALSVLSAHAQTPPQRDFGPDTTSTGDPHTGRGLVTPGLSCTPPAGPPSLPLECTGYLASALDGTMLDVTVWVPRTAPPFPLVVGVHGWGGSKRSMNKYAERITAEGYALIAYSTRGFGDSFGQVNLADVNVEAVDLRSIISQVADHPRVHADPGRVAVFGASYGGAHAWLAALQPLFTTPRGKTVRIRTIVPLVPWTELTGALRPNGRRHEPIEPAGGFKFSFVEGLYIGGCEDFPVCSNYPEYLKQWNAWMAAAEPSNSTPLDQQIVDGMSGYRSIYWQKDFWQHVVTNKTSGLPQLPIFQAHGFTDYLFPLDEVLRMYDKLKEIDPAYPIAFYLGDVGHPSAPNKPAEVGYIFEQIFAWLAWYLKGEGSPPFLDVQAAITRPKNQPFNPADVIRVPSYADLASGNVTFTFDDSDIPTILTFNPANPSGFIWDPFIMLGAEELEFFPGDVPADFVPGDVAVYEVPVATLTGGLNLLLAGQSMVTLTLSQILPTCTREQLNARLFAVKPDGARHLITRGTYTIDTEDPLDPIGVMTVTIPTYGNVYEAAADEVIRLEISNVDSPYLKQSAVASVTELTNVSLTIPYRQ